MLSKNITMKTLVAGAALFAGSAALAFDYNGLYVTGGAGYGSLEDGRFAGPNDLSALKANDSLIWHAGVGNWITRNVGLEFNWHGMKGTHDNASLRDTDGNIDSAKLDVTRANFFDLSAIGRCFINKNFSLYGRLGPAYADVRREVKLYENSQFIGKGTSEDGGVGAAIGVGAQYDFTPMIGVRLDAMTIQANNNNDLYAVTGNLVVNFGGFM